MYGYQRITLRRTTTGDETPLPDPNPDVLSQDTRAKVHAPAALWPRLRHAEHALRLRDARFAHPLEEYHAIELAKLGRYSVTG